MPARANWKDGDCTSQRCNCTITESTPSSAHAVILPRVTGKTTDEEVEVNGGALKRPRPFAHTRTHSRETETTPAFTRPTSTLPPVTKTIFYGPTPEPGSYFWK
jgi:hypothetical protein